MVSGKHLMAAALCAALLATLRAPGTPSVVGAAGAPTVQYKTVRFVNTLPGAIAHGKSVAMVPFDPNTPPSDDAPAHIAFSFNPYYPTLFAPNSTFPPALAVYPVATFSAYHWSSELKQLQQILKTRPNLAATKSLPYLPQLPAAQVIHARAAYRTFPSGTGISYLTFYAQDVSPVTSTRLFYTFQGLTRDGAYYVSATFPVHIGFLPDKIPSTFDYTSFEKTYNTYIAHLITRLNAATAPATITPSLTQLNQLVTSVTVSG